MCEVYKVPGVVGTHPVGAACVRYIRCLVWSAPTRHVDCDYFRDDDDNIYYCCTSHCKMVRTLSDPNKLVSF